MSWARRAGIAGAALGALATGVAAGVAVERLTVHRTVRRTARLALDATAPFGTLRGTPGTAFADDGTELYYEVDGEPDDGESDDGGADDGGPEAGRSEAGEPAHDEAGDEAGGEPEGEAVAARRVAPTVVFSHGYCLAQDVWHFQRAALRETGTRAVFWDQRAHGRSARGPNGHGGEPDTPVTIERLGRDLRAVLDAAVPDGPVVLVGHSMGGMTMMALAEQYPEWVARRVTGAVFLATSAGALDDVTYGFPAPAARAVRRVLPGVLRALGSQAALVERGRRALGDVYAGIVRRYSFGSPKDVDPAVARFAERLIDAVPVDVVAAFYPAFGEHDKTAALGVYAGLGEALETLVLAGDRDELTPPEHSERLAAAIPCSRLVMLPGAGHLVLLEQPEQVNAHLAELLARSIGSHEPGV
ncbi:alpha/beta fold hydrolase [Streptomyces sp. 4N509B]|uniref:alpha/beta fold hydrolase n=1 Tax=Streptomyces sp. 4N509B TaxID=3457413 RepID=UPI003FD09A9D